MLLGLTALWQQEQDEIKKRISANRVHDHIDTFGYAEAGNQRLCNQGSKLAIPSTMGIVGCQFNSALAR